MLNPAAATYVTDPEPVDSPTVDSEDPLGIVSIRLFSTVDHCRGNCHQGVQATISATEIPVNTTKQQFSTANTVTLQVY